MYAASEIAEKVRTGALPPASLIEEQLSLIQSLDDRLGAWVEVDSVSSRAAAREIEAGKRSSGTLLSVPVGVKDIIDVAHLPTRAGVSSFGHHHPEQDAFVVSRLRQAGAIILGKTATTQFAYMDPAPTRNPWNREHTPGGSSSGSAAAVAAGMAPVALGTQTVGSVLRPAAYCGIVGLKGTYGRVSLGGVLPLAPSLDHVGILCGSIVDAALVFSVIAGHDPAAAGSLDAPAGDYIAAARDAGQPPLLGLPRRFFRDVADPEVGDHVEQVARRFAGAGATIREVEMPLGARELRALGEPVLRFEAAAAHASLYAAHQQEYGPHFRALMEQGRATSETEYAEARAALRQLREQLVALVGDVGVLLLPVAPSTAPLGLASTGDPVFCAPASFAGLPAIALPSGLSRDGLPLAIQLVAPPLAEAQLLGAAAWAEQLLDFRAVPPATLP